MRLTSIVALFFVIPSCTIIDCKCGAIEEKGFEVNVEDKVMTNLTDKKPLACGGEVLRRTDSHIIGNSKYPVTESGDRFIAPPIRNFALTTTPDNDPRWGDKQEECENANGILTLDGTPLITETETNNIVQE